MAYGVEIAHQSYSFRDLADLLAKASPARSERASSASSQTTPRVAEPHGRSAGGRPLPDCKDEDRPLATCD